MTGEIKTVRDAFGDRLVELGATNKDIVVLTGDLTGATRVKKFAQAYPDRFFNVGIAEQNMLGIAAGLASGGKIPIVSSFAVFAAGRAWDQTRMVVAYSRMNVKIVATHAGLVAALEGTIHQCTEDVAIMRAIANMTVIVPSDDLEVEQCMQAIVEYRGPVYVRIGRAIVPRTTPDDYKFEIGKAVVLREGKDATIVANGIMCALAMEAADVLAGEGVEVEVINLHTVKPLDTDTLLSSVRKTGTLVTIEEHSVIGGTGAAVSEALFGKVDAHVKLMGVPDCFSETGKPEQIMEQFGLTSEKLAQNVRELLG